MLGVCGSDRTSRPTRGFLLQVARKSGDPDTRPAVTGACGTDSSFAKTHQWQMSRLHHADRPLPSPVETTDEPQVDPNGLLGGADGYVHAVCQTRELFFST